MGNGAQESLEEKTNEGSVEVRVRTLSRKVAGISHLENNVNEGAEIGAHLSLCGGQKGEREGWREGGWADQWMDGWRQVSFCLCKNVRK